MAWVFPIQITGPILSINNGRAQPVAWALARALREIARAKAPTTAFA